MANDYALYFDGVDDYVEIPAHPDLNVLDTTITFWFKADKGVSLFLLRAGPDPAGPVYAVYLTLPGRLIWTYFDGTNDLWVETPYPLINNRWYFCQAQLITNPSPHPSHSGEGKWGGVIRVRINQRPWISASFSAISRVPDLAPLRFGLTPFTPPPDWIPMPLRGTMDEIKIYNRVLKDYELDWWWNNGAGRYGYEGELGLVAGYHLDEGVDATCYDFSGHGHNGTITGALWTSGYVRKGVIDMSIVSHVKLAIAFPETAPQWASDKWAKGLKDNAEHIKESLDLRFPDDESFQLWLAEPANKDFAKFVNPSYVSRSGVNGAGIVSGHIANLKRSFQKFLQGINAIFPQGFKDRVEAAKDSFSKGLATRCLPFTGTRRGGRGVAPIAARWLTGDPIGEGLLRPGDEVLEGGSYLICPRAKMPGLRAMLNQRLVQAGVEIIKSGMNAAVITAQNQLTAEQVQGFVDPTLNLIPFVAGGDSHVDYVVINGQPYLDIQVSKM